MKTAEQIREYLRMVIAELDLEIEGTLPLLLGADFIMQMDSVGLK